MENGSAFIVLFQDPEDAVDGFDGFTGLDPLHGPVKALLNNIMGYQTISAVPASLRFWMIMSRLMLLAEAVARGGKYSRAVLGLQAQVEAEPAGKREHRSRGKVVS